MGYDQRKKTSSAKVTKETSPFCPPFSEPVAFFDISGKLDLRHRSVNTNSVLALLFRFLRRLTPPLFNTHSLVPAGKIDGPPVTAVDMLRRVAAP